MKPFNIVIEVSPYYQRREAHAWRAMIGDTGLARGPHPQGLDDGVTLTEAQAHADAVRTVIARLQLTIDKLRSENPE